MVAGGPYGLEDIIGKAGYGRALLLLAVIPFLWSLPTALMVGELASAMPCEGGYYVWVRRALGPFWGFQEAWLSLAASVFDMALYPVTFVSYLARVAPSWTAGHRGVLWAFVMVIGCALWNLRGAAAVGEGSVGMFLLLLAPFVGLIVLALFRWHGHGAGALHQPPSELDLPGAIAVCLWNYMGWDNASTVAQEVDNPQRNYPRAMLGSAALVAGTYIVPLLAVALAGIPAAQFSTGAWADAARTVAGPVLALAIVLGGLLNGVGMFNPLMMSYTRLPIALAEDGLLPRAFARLNRFGAPWLSILACAAIWALALGMTFERLISIDLILYGSALLLEFIALIVLRRREPALPRPFRVPGGMAGAVLVSVTPALLIAFALWTARHERLAGMPSLLFAALVAATGALVFPVAKRLYNPLKRTITG